MAMKRPVCSTFSDDIQLALDGELGGGRAAALSRHLSGCAACREESAQLASLERVLAASRIVPREGLRWRVSEALPPAGWEARHPRSWIAAALIMALLAAGGAALVGTGWSGPRSAMPILGAVAAVIDLLRSSALAGAGLLGASWRGLGVAFEQVIGGSLWNLLAVAAVVLGLDLLLIRLLLRRPGRAARRVDGRGAGGG